MFNYCAVTERNSIGSASVARAERFLAEREWRLEARSVTPFPERATLGLMTVGAGLFAVDGRVRDLHQTRKAGSGKAKEMRGQCGSVIQDKCRALIGECCGRSRRIDGEMAEVARHMTVMKWMMVLMIGLEMATLVMLPENPVHQPAYQTLPKVRSLRLGGAAMLP